MHAYKNKRYEDYIDQYLNEYNGGEEINDPSYTTQRFEKTVYITVAVLALVSIGILSLLFV